VLGWYELERVDAQHGVVAVLDGEVLEPTPPHRHVRELVPRHGEHPAGRVDAFHAPSRVEDAPPVLAGAARGIQHQPALRRPLEQLVEQASVGSRDHAPALVIAPAVHAVVALLDVAQALGEPPAPRRSPILHPDPLEERPPGRLPQRAASPGVRSACIDARARR
jgi:hypothetical protein